MSRQSLSVPSAAGHWSRVRYRISQFWRGLRATVTQDERDRIAGFLTTAALDLFDRMPADAQRHSLNVLQSLRRAGHRQPELWAAAILHDVGKLAADEAGVRLGLWARGPLVLAEALAPGLVRSLARDDAAAGWRYALHVHQDHPRIGAAWAQAAGCSALTCWLIAHHQDAAAAQSGDASLDAPARLLAALQWADGRN